MKKVDLAFPEFLFIVATRAALGAGAALLATRRCSRQGRQRLGAVLFSVGVVTTVPALYLPSAGRGGVSCTLP